jgi:peptidoglycan/xylan/chitin deacetylase (PgdA/CDA1 family)
MKLTVRLLAVLSLAAACAPTDEIAIQDDAETGDSLPFGDKSDGYTVPSSLALNKNKVVYLTFDDGPSATHTPRILDILASHDAKATFFVTGLSIAGNENVIRRAAAEGHIIANHQWRHVQASSSTFRGYVTRGRDTLRGIAGDMPLFFRYPYGAMLPWKETILREEGYVDGGVGWDVDSLDWDFGPDARASRGEVPEQFKRDFEGYVMFRLNQRGGGVVLFHDVQSITSGHLESLLNKMEAAGYTFGELPRNRPRPTFIGDACDADEECTFAGGFCLGGLCTQACTATCPDRAGYPTTRCARLTDEEGDQVQVCASDCATAGCREGECVSAQSPSGAARKVCWGL